MADSASLKIDRASEHINELNELFNKERPFYLSVQTDTQTRERIMRPKQDEAVTNKTALIVGEIVHNLRSALDHAYWEIVSPLCTTTTEIRSIQFPFCAKADRLDSVIQQRLAHYVGTGFYCGIRKLLPHGEPGGNELLYMIDELDILDKHKLLIPTADQAELSGKVLRQFVPDCPFDFGKGKIFFTSCVFSWKYQGTLSSDQLGQIQIPSYYIFERKLDLPVDVVFNVRPLGKRYPVIPTLNALIDTTRKTIELMKATANSYSSRIPSEYNLACTRFRRHRVQANRPSWANPF